MTNRERAESMVWDISGTESGMDDDVDAIESALNEAEARGLKRAAEIIKTGCVFCREVEPRTKEPAMHDCLNLRNIEIIYAIKKEIEK